MALPLCGAPTPTFAERQLHAERSAKKFVKKKSAKDMDKVAQENEEAAENKCPLGSAENPEGADDHKDLVSGMFKFHSWNGVLQDSI